MYDTSNAVEELKQPRKSPTSEKVEAIKDALKHWGIFDYIVNVIKNTNYREVIQ